MLSPRWSRRTRVSASSISRCGGSPLRPGMFARAEILIEPRRRSCCHRRQSSYRDDAPAAFVQNADNSVSLRRLTTGAHRDGFVEVFGGLRQGELVVTSGAGFLSDGDRVRVVAPLAIAAQLIRGAQARDAHPSNLADGEYRNISAWAIRNPIPVVVLFLLLIAGGLICLPGAARSTTPRHRLPAVVGHRHPARRRAGRDGDPDHPAGRGRHRRRLGDVKHVPRRSPRASPPPRRVRHRQGPAEGDRRGARPDRADPRRSCRADIARADGHPRSRSPAAPILTYAVVGAGDDATSSSPGSSTTRSPATLLSVPGVAQVTRIGGVDARDQRRARSGPAAALGITATQVNARCATSTSTRRAAAAMVGGREQTIRDARLRCARSTQLRDAHHRAAGAAAPCGWATWPTVSDGDRRDPHRCARSTAGRWWASGAAAARQLRGATWPTRTRRRRRRLEAANPGVKITQGRPIPWIRDQAGFHAADGDAAGRRRAAGRAGGVAVPARLAGDADHPRSPCRSR